MRAIVLEVNVEKKRLGLGLKPSYFDAEDFADSDAEMADGDASEAEDGADSDEEEAESGEDLDGQVEDSDDEGSDASLDDDDFEGADESLARLLAADAPFEEESDVESDEESEEAAGEAASDAESDAEDGSEDEAPRNVAPALELSGGFSWSAPDAVEAADAGDSGSDSESDDDEAAEASASKSKKRKAKAAAAPQQDMTADLATKAPESTADFERLLLGSPHSSYLWIQFMSFQLQLSDIDKAREVARRALKVISFREEQERMNVWIALLNLENAYGTAETLDTVFKQAAQANDSKTVHLRLLAILEKSDKLDAAEELWRKTAKKFGYSSKVWVGWVQFYLRHDRAEDARKLVPRSMQSLEKRKRELSCARVPCRQLTCRHRRQDGAGHCAVRVQARRHGACAHRVRGPRRQPPEAPRHLAAVRRPGGAPRRGGQCAVSDSRIALPQQLLTPPGAGISSSASSRCGRAARRPSRCCAAGCSSSRSTAAPRASRACWRVRVRGPSRCRRASRAARRRREHETWPAFTYSITPQHLVRLQ